jgi:hypothetical protein
MTLPRQLKTFGLAGATAVAAGLAIGSWAAPPAYLAQPVVRLDPVVLSQEDPNRVRYRAMLAAEGVSPTPCVLAVYPPPLPDLSSAADAAADQASLEATIARETEAFEARARRWEAERIAWLEAERARWAGPVLATADIAEAAGGPKSSLTQD